MPEDLPHPSELDRLAGDRRDPESTRELVDRARRGDQEAVDRLFPRHMRPRQWERADAWHRGRATSPTPTVSSSTPYFRRLGTLQTSNPRAFQAFLRQAVVNRLRNELRRKGRLPKAIDVDEKELDPSLLTLLAELDRSLGLRREACEGLRAALAHSVGNQPIEAAQSRFQCSGR